jgi:hypothetical protein
MLSIIISNHVLQIYLKKNKFYGLTKYVVGANANPPKNPRRAPKNGKVIPTNIVNAESKIFIIIRAKQIAILDFMKKTSRRKRTHEISIIG